VADIWMRKCHVFWCIYIFLIMALTVSSFACVSKANHGNATGENLRNKNHSSGADDDADEDREPQINLPEYPFWSNKAFIINADYMEKLAAPYCDVHTGNLLNEKYFLGFLPMKTFDLFFGDPSDHPNMQTLMGNLYISGYFGGIWLRDAINMEEMGEFIPDAFTQFTFDLIANYTAHQIGFVISGIDEDILEKAYNHMPILLFIYAYNLGYLEQIIEHPPQGIEPPAQKLICHEDLLLDCNATEQDFPFLDRYESIIEKLRNPPNERWLEMAELCAASEWFIQGGRDVWNVIDISSLDANNYQLLLDLSINFLLASKAATLGNMTTWADYNFDEGRHSLLVDSGMISWSGSYFMGLSSKSPVGTFPQLICP